MNPTPRSDSPICRLGLGCMSMTGSYGHADPQEAAATLLEAADSGITLFDTGDFYGDGANEELLGRTLAPRRDPVVLATKTGVRRTPWPPSTCSSHAPTSTGSTRPSRKMGRTERGMATTAPA